MRRLLSLVSLALLSLACGQEPPPDLREIAARQAALTVPVGADLSLFQWERPLATGDRIALQPHFLSDCYLGVGFTCGRAPAPGLTGLLTIEVLGSATSGASYDLRLRTESGEYLKAPRTSAIQTAWLQTTWDPAQATRFRLDRGGTSQYGLLSAVDAIGVMPCGRLKIHDSTGVSAPMGVCGLDMSGASLNNPTWIYAAPARPRRNLALGRPTWQSSTNQDAGASWKAVDGNVDGAWDAGSVTHTNSEARPSWVVDLGAPMPLSQIVLFNRTDCCSDRLHDVSIALSVDGSPLTWFTQGGVVGKVLTFNVANQTARYVRVQMDAGGILSLAEVQVFGRYDDISLFRPAGQSSTLYGADASRAVDGLVNATWNEGSVTHTDQGYSFWWVDLAPDRYVDHVVVYNRSDCCGGRLSGAKVEVVNRATGVRSEIGRLSGAPVERLNALLFGDRVVISTTRPEYLSLAEVIVAGR